MPEKYEKDMDSLMKVASDFKFNSKKMKRLVGKVLLAYRFPLPCKGLTYSNICSILFARNLKSENIFERPLGFCFMRPT